VIDALHMWALQELGLESEDGHINYKAFRVNARTYGRLIEAEVQALVGTEIEGHKVTRAEAERAARRYYEMRGPTVLSFTPPWAPPDDHVNILVEALFQAA